MERHLRPAEAATLLQRMLVETGYRGPGKQADAVLSVLRARFARATVEDDQTVVETMLMLGVPDGRVWDALQGWCTEYGRDPAVVWQNVWAPDLQDGGDPQG